MSRAEDIFERIRHRGLPEIREFIQTRQSEELFLDFKRSSDCGRGARLSDNDRNNLARAMSGFANSEGGVLVWGVDCSRTIDGADVANGLFPVEDPQRFRSWIEGAISGCTVPPHPNVANIVVPNDDENTGYVVTLIPKSNHAPHQAIPKRQYYIRAGSDFVPTPHDVLSGLFGRRPQPHVFQMFTIAPARLDNDGVHFELGIMIHNDGPGIATDVFITLLVRSNPGPQSTLAFKPLDSKNWTGSWSLGRQLSLISNPDRRLPPSAHYQPVSIVAKMAPPFEAPLDVAITLGCSQSEPTRFSFENSADAIRQVFDRLMARSHHEVLLREDCAKFPSLVLGMDRPQLQE